MRGRRFVKYGPFHVLMLLLFWLASQDWTTEPHILYPPLELSVQEVLCGPFGFKDGHLREDFRLQKLPIRTKPPNC